jgi:hypothetical protein
VPAERVKMLNREKKRLTENGKIMFFSAILQQEGDVVSEKERNQWKKLNLVL